ncbi:MAG: glycosyltransferase family 4 protein [Acidobacteria bacterium]|nr:glycosyltransferase family 4 protein [Acidobacteriota bacterium]
MKVLFLDNEITWRGGQEQIFTLLGGLQQRGIEVALLAPAGGPLSEKARQLKIPHIPLCWKGELTPAHWPTLHRVLKGKRWDIVHFNTPSGITMAAFLSRRAGVPVRVLSRRVNFPLRGALSRWKYLYSADYIIAVSSGIRETLVRNGIPRDRIDVVYEGVDVAELEAVDPRRLYPATELVIGCVAFLSREKGHAVLLEAFARLRRRRPATRLVLVGDGPQRPLLERQAAELGISGEVRFVGFQEEVASFLRGFDIFVLPSLSEGLSSSILAAMAVSLPVVASNVGGIPELVLPGTTGLLVPPGEARELAGALEHLADHPGLRAGCGAAGRRRVLEKFRVDQKVEKTLAIYRSLLSGRRAEAS